MTRIKSSTEKPELDKKSLVDFFDQRAAKISRLGATQAVIYQDKNPDLALRRDAAEKQVIFPTLNLNTSSVVLDIGCGTGRWAKIVLPHCAYYHGLDISAGFIDFAKNRFLHIPHANFSQLDFNIIKQSFSPDFFNRVLIFGVLIYLNDREITEAFSALNIICQINARIVIREPVCLSEDRLTLKDFYSQEMDQTYNAIYRNENELDLLIQNGLGESWTKTQAGDVYEDSALNNRLETKQRWFVWEKLS
jgi:ubiquinone/menaquinone biosynthesis C-methylase UbiE